MKIKLPVRLTQTPRGVSLEFDSDQETLLLLDSQGQPLGRITWGAMIGFIRQSVGKSPRAEKRDYSRAPLAVKVEYQTSEGSRIDGLTGDLGGGGLFIETSTPLPQGITLTVEFGLPETPSERIRATGQVAWARRDAERYLFPSGMGVQFTNISAEAKSKIIEFVDALNRARGKAQ